MKFLTIALVAFAAITSTARASDQTGVYAKISKVVLLPNETEPTSVQIYGTFAFADVSGRVYQPAQVGYVQYGLPQGKEALARAEWSDLKNLAGTNSCVGYGQRRDPNGTPHRMTTRNVSNETYPIGFGLQKIAPAHPECRLLGGTVGRE